MKWKKKEPPKEQRKKNRFLAKQVTRMVCLICCVLTFVILVENFMMTRQIMLKDTEDFLQERVSYYEDVVEHWFALRLEHMNILKGTFEGMTAEELTDIYILKELTNSTEYGLDLGVLSDYMVYPDGKMLCGDGWIPPEGYDPRVNTYYTEPAKTGKLAVSEPYVDATSGNFIITLSIPVHVDGKLFGVLARDLCIDDVRDIANAYQSEDGSYLYLLDNGGNVLCHANPEFQPTGEKIQNSSMLTGMDFLGQIAEQTGLYHSKDYDAQDKYFLSRKSELTGWTVGLVYPQKVIVDRLTVQLGICMVSFLIVLLVSNGIIFAYVKRKLKPIQGVLQAAREIEKGNLQVVHAVESRDEIGQLAETFRSTTEYLQEVIGEISRVLTHIAAGNLTVHTDCEYRGDFEQIHQSIEHITNTLNSMIGGIRNASEQVAFNSENVALNAQRFSQNAIEQAARMDELVESCERISDIVQENVNKCEAAGQTTAEVSEKLTSGNQQMQQMTEEMHRINESSQQIGAINKTIEEIAFQTNILALNAAVEAARAGAAGKGFAVVADEVRNLAGKSAEAAQNTTQLIDNSIQMIGKGTALSDETAEAVMQVVSIAEQVYDMIQQLVELSRKQAEEITQISDGIRNASGLIQVNSATAEESAAASRELSDQAQMMKNLIAHFQTK